MKRIRMFDDYTTYNTETGEVCSPLESRPVIVIKKGKRKINPLFEELLKSVPQDVIDRIEKAFTCAHLTNGDECLLGGNCNPDGCVAWEHYETVTK